MSVRSFTAPDPVFGFGVAQGLAPVVSGWGEGLLARDSERKSGLPASGDEFGRWLTVAGDDHGFAFLDQFDEP